MKHYIKAMRIHQYSKNLFIFAPAFFGFAILENLAPLIAVFVGFCAMASSVYIFNDILDRNVDKSHPTKRFRPISRGDISLKNAAIFGAILLIFSFALIFILTPYLSNFSNAHLIGGGRMLIFFG